MIRNWVLTYNVRIIQSCSQFNVCCSKFCVCFSIFSRWLVLGLHLAQSKSRKRNLHNMKIQNINYYTENKSVFPLTFCWRFHKPLTFYLSPSICMAIDIILYSFQMFHILFGGNEDTDTGPLRGLMVRTQNDKFGIKQILPWHNQNNMESAMKWISRLLGGNFFKIC